MFFRITRCIPFSSPQNIMLHNQPFLLLSFISVLSKTNRAAPYHYLFSILLSVPPIMSTPHHTMQLPITISSPFSCQFLPICPHSPLLHTVASTARHFKRAFLQITCNLVSAVRIRMMDFQIVIWNQTIVT
jgi:hypothetical protein